VRKCQPDIHLTTVAYPIKNTGFYENAGSSVVLNKEWSVATDRDHLIKGRHSRSYYKQADVWLNSEVAASRLDGSDPLQAGRHRAAAAQARDSMVALSAQTEA
jgi:anaerobic magnesium-protoporphyrin IX monomethyl ester cyclase